MKNTFVPRFFDTNQIDGVWEYVKAIDWSEPWLVGLLVFHVTTFLLIVGLRRYTNFQGILFLCLLGLAFASEQLNVLGAKHWRTFSRDQYFDSFGLFISVVYAGPILFNCFIITVLWLWTAGKMLIVVKRGQLKELSKKQSGDKKVN
ncbi:PREDICTED: transmembrane protein 18-like [Acropora digitifera]|uniref:transmembrane protein 18-like n=1 Tax=Acropora digitifera TaxID=70779 RepID=UPI00077AA79A|nr:PREDICTED: transmembrane protein 18-like [Acropora digitifera]